MSKLTILSEFEAAIEKAIRGDKTALAQIIRKRSFLSSKDREILAQYIEGSRKLRRGEHRKKAFSVLGFDPSAVRVSPARQAAIYVQERMDELRHKGERVRGAQPALIKEAAKANNVTEGQVRSALKKGGLRPIVDNAHS